MLDPEAEPGGCVCDEESSTRNLPANGAPPIGVNHFGGEVLDGRLALSPGGSSSRHNPQPAALTAAAAPHLATRVRDGYEAWLLALADTPIARHEADGHGRDLPRDAALQDAAPIAAVAPSPSVTTDGRTANDGDGPFARPESDRNQRLERTVEAPGANRTSRPVAWGNIDDT